MVALGEIASVDRQVIGPTHIDDGTTYIGLEHIERGGRLLGSETIGDFTVASAKHKFTRDHILYGKLRPNLGKIVRPGFDGVCSTDILPIRPGETIDRSFLFYYLSQQQMVDHAASRTSGANLPRLSPKELLNFAVPLPPINEQRRIAGILDGADQTLEKVATASNAVLGLTSRSFDQIFATSRTRRIKLSELAEISSGITIGRKLRDNTSTTEIPYLSVSNVKDRHLNLQTVKTVAATAQEQMKFALAPGDLLLTEGGDPDKLGRGTLWAGEIPGMIHQNHIFRVRLKEGSEVSPTFLSWFTSSREARAYFLRNAKQTTGIASINKTQLGNLPVAVPSRSQQDKFERVARIADVHAKRLSKRAEHVDSLLTSLQSRAFRGEL